MDLRIEDDTVVIELPLEEPRPSATGKTLLIASTRGVQSSTAKVNGKQVSAVANVFIYGDAAISKRQGEAKATLKRRLKERQDADDEGDSNVSRPRAKKRRVKFQDLLDQRFQ